MEGNYPAKRGSGCGNPARIPTYWDSSVDPCVARERTP